MVSWSFVLNVVNYLLLDIDETRDLYREMEKNMNFVYEIKSNIEVGEKLYGIVEGSIYTYDGVYEIVVNEIDYNRKIVVFDIDQPCKQVACDFYEMEHYVFETEDEANAAFEKIEWANGLRDYSVYY